MPDITEIRDINETIRQGTQYALPTTVKAEMSDGTYRVLPAAWTLDTVDVNTPGAYEFEGTAEGFTRKIKLSLTVKPLEQQVDMGSYLKISLDTFFSSFSEAYVKPFEESKISSEALINFGIMHIMLNDWWRVNNLVITKEGDPNNGYIKSSDVDKACYKYFGIKPAAHKSIKGYRFEGECYKFPYASADVIAFSQINKLVETGDDFYRAEIAVYEASSAFAGDLHGTVSDWKKTAPYNVPKLKKKMTAKIKRVSEAGKERYILISYN